MFRDPGMTCSHGDRAVGLPRLKHAPTFRTLHLLGTDPLDLGWRDRVTARWADGVQRGHDIRAVDLALAHRVILLQHPEPEPCGPAG
jgi:hypothetical protein